MSAADRAILEELARRQMAHEATLPVISAIRAELFDKQLAFLDDKDRRKAALCTRRAGKTSMWARYCTIVGLKTPRGVIRVWGITRLRVKQLLWDEFKLVLARHSIKHSVNETELTLRLENGAEIRLLGADKDKEVQKKRGDKTIFEVVLEAQLFGPYLKTLVEDVAEPCLFDLQGTFCLEGTPGPVCAGYWYEVSGRNDGSARWASVGNSEGVGAGWSCHRWSVLDNPFVPHARAELSLLVKKRRWADDNPTYVREWQGKWVNDLGALFYKYDPLRNGFTLDEMRPWGTRWEHILGWDLGFRDDMAVTVWGFHPKLPDLYEAFSWKKPGALMPELEALFRKLETEGEDGTPFNLVAQVADTGGGGKMFVEEFCQRYGRQFEAAKKTEKYEHVRLYNDDLQGGFIKIQHGSPLALEIASLPRDPDWPDPDNPEKPPKEDSRFANHCLDASLYSYRRARHYLHRPEPAKVPVNSETWYRQEARRMEEHVLQQAQKREMSSWLYPDDDAEDSEDL